MKHLAWTSTLELVVTKSRIALCYTVLTYLQAVELWCGGRDILKRRSGTVSQCRICEEPSGNTN